MTSTAEIEWNAAVADSGLPADELILRVESGTGLRDGRGAVYWSPNTVDWASGATADDLRPAVDELGGKVGYHRFALWCDRPAPELAALARHELEHARQWQRHGNGLFAMHEVTKPALWDKTDTLPFAGILINNVAPIELDANAAAARFAWDRHGEAVQDLIDAKTEHEVLFRYRGGPEPLETLPERTVRFAHLFRERCERIAANEGLDFAEVLEQRFPGAGDFWRALNETHLERIADR
jgi:hypothetical protein